MLTGKDLLVLAELLLLLFTGGRLLLGCPDPGKDLRDLRLFFADLGCAAHRSRGHGIVFLLKARDLSFDTGNVALGEVLLLRVGGIFHTHLFKSGSALIALLLKTRGVLFHFPGLLLDLLFGRFGRIQLRKDRAAVFLHLADLPVDVGIFLFQRVPADPADGQLLLRLFSGQLQGIELQHEAVHLAVDLRLLIAHLVAGFFLLLDADLQGLALGAEVLDRHLQFLDLPLSAQQVVGIAEGAAGDGAAGGEGLALQRHHIDAVMIFSSDTDRVIDIRDYERPPQEILLQYRIFGSGIRKIRGHADDALLAERPLIVEAAAPKRGERQERAAPEPVSLQVLDHVLGRGFVVGDDVAEAAAQSGLNGDLVLLRHVDQVRDDAADPRIALFLLHGAADAVAVAVVALCHGLQGVPAGRILMVGGQHLVEALLVFGDIRLEGFDLRLRLIERVLPGMDLVRDALHFPTALGEGLFGSGFFLAKTEEPPADLGLADAHLLPHGIVALDPAFDGGAAVQHADHVIFRTADKGSRLCQLLIEGSEFLLRLLLLPPDLPKGPGHFPELLLPLRFFPAAAADLRSDGFPAAAVVLPAHLDGADLLPEDLRIAA